MDHAGVGWVIQGWGGSHRWGGVGDKGVGLGGPYRVGDGHIGVGWVIQGWDDTYRGGMGHTGVG